MISQKEKQEIIDKVERVLNPQDLGIISDDRLLVVLDFCLKTIIDNKNKFG